MVQYDDKNVELKIIAVLQGNTSKEKRMTLKELTARVYSWDKMRNSDGMMKAL